MADPAGTQGLNYAGLVTGNPYSSIAQLIAQKQRQIAETNPYILGASSMPDIQFNPNREGSDIAQGVQGILKGLLAGYGIKNARQEQADYAQGLSNALASSGGVGTLAMDPRYSDVAAQLALEDRQINNKVAGDLLIRKFENDQDSKQKILAAYAQANTPRQRAQVESAAHALGILPKDASLGGDGSAAPNIAPANAPAPELKPLFPGNSLENRRRSMLNYLMNEQGLPGGAAQKEVEDQLNAYKVANKESVDKAEAARKRAQNLSEIAQTAEAGVQGAGITGGFGWGARNLASLAYSAVSPEENQQRTAQGLLDSVGPSIVQMSRSPGAVSDYETRMYLGAGPNSRNTPELNAQLIEKMKGLAAIEGDYANFLDAYRAEKGTTQPTQDSPGADALWQTYKQKNPIFIATPSGELQINPNRTPWRQFFSGQAAPIEQPQVSQQQAPGQYSADDEARIQQRMRELSGQ